MQLFIISFPMTTGWWLTYPSEKYDESSVGMMTISQLYGKIIQMFQTTNQLCILMAFLCLFEIEQECASSGKETKSVFDRVCLHHIHKQNISNTLW